MFRGEVLFHGGIPEGFVVPDMQGNLLQFAEDGHHAGGVADLDFLSDIPVGHTLIMMIIAELDMSVFHDRHPAELPYLKSLGGKRDKCLLLFLVEPHIPTVRFSLELF